MKQFITAGITLTLSQFCLADASPWLTDPGSTSVSITQVHQTSDEFYVDDKKGDLPFDDLEQNTTWFSLNHGISDNLALDLKVGYASSESVNDGTDDESSYTDSNLGLTWRFIDEFISDYNLPSTAIRAGVVLQGDYDTGAPNSIGDGGDAFELSVVSGKVLNSWFAISGEAGYRWRNSDVPDEVFYQLGAYVFPVDGLTFSAAYSKVDSQGDLNLNSPDFSARVFHKLQEDVELVTLGVSYNILEKLNVGVSAAEVIDGRNTAKSDIYALTVGYSL